MKTYIEIDGTKHELESGLVSATAIYELVGCHSRQLFVNRPDDIDIPLDPTSFLVIRGNESLFTGESSIEDNPPLRNPIQIAFNGEPGPLIRRAKITGKELKEFDSEHSAGRLFVDMGVGPDIEIPDETRLLIYEDIRFFVIPARDGSGFGDPIDIEDCARRDRSPPKGQKYRIGIDREKYIIEQEWITGSQILALVQKTSDDWALNRKFRGGRRERIKADDVVEVSQPGMERFETVRRQAQQGRD